MPHSSYAGLLPSIDAVERVRGALPPILRVSEPSEPVAISIFEIARQIELQRKLPIFGFLFEGSRGSDHFGGDAHP